MSRDSTTGVYTAPTNSFNPAVTRTSISSAAWNAFLDDLESVISDTLDAPASSTDNSIARFDGVTGKFIQNSGVTIDDSNNMLFPTGTYLDWNSGDVRLTHSSNQLSWTGGTNYQFDAKITSAAHAGSAIAPIFVHDPTVQGTIGTVSGEVGGFKWGGTHVPTPFTNNGNYINDVWHQGINVGTLTGGVGRIDTSKPMLAMSFEGKYWNGSVFGLEWHIQGVSTDGLTTFRPISVFAAHDASQYATSINGDSLTLANRSSVQKFYFDAAGNVFDINNSARIRLGTNNVVALQQINAAADAFIDLIWVNANNDVRIGGPAWMTGVRNSSGTHAGSFLTIQPSDANSGDTIFNGEGPAFTGSHYAFRVSGAPTLDFTGAIYNNSNNTTANALIELRTIGAGGGDPFIHFNVSGVTSFAFGIDNSDSDKLKISSGGALGTSDVLTITSTALNTPLQVTNALGTITTSKPFTITQTWNDAGVTFNGLLVNVTDTASAAASLLADLQVGGSSKFKVSKAGVATAAVAVNVPAGSAATPSVQIGSSSTGWYSSATDSIIDLSISGTQAMRASANGFFYATSAGRFVVSSGGSFTFSSGVAGGDGEDVKLYRDAAGTIAQRDGTNAQTHNHYDTYTSATDYHRLAIKTARATLSGVTGASVTATGLIPDGAVVVGVTSKVTTGLGVTGGTTGYTVGDGTTANRWGAITGTAAGTSSDNRDWTVTTVQAFTAANNVVITATGGNFDGTGVIYVSVQYLIGQCD